MYDIIIVGGGIAAFSAALFASRRGLNVLVIAKDLGGQANWTDLIENYPGLWETGGFELVETIKKQAEVAGAKTLISEVLSVKEIAQGFVVKTYLGQFKSQALILAFGKTPRDLKVAGEEHLKGKGISYCANCDAPLYKHKVVSVAGVGNLALDTALLLSKYAKKVYLLSKSEKVEGNPALIKAVGARKNIELLPFVQIEKVGGEQRVESLTLLNLKSKAEKELITDGLFVELGYATTSEFVKNLVELDEEGQIKVSDTQATSKPGVFAAGDCTNRVYKQAAISVGEGVTAALAAYDWLMRQEGRKGLTSDWTEIKKAK